MEGASTWDHMAHHLMNGGEIGERGG